MTPPDRSDAAVLFDLYGTLADVEIDEMSPHLWNALASYVGERELDDSGAALRERFFDLCRVHAERRGTGAIMSHVIASLLGVDADTSSGRADVREFAVEFRRRSTTSLSLREYTRPLLSELRRSRLRLGLVSKTEALLTDVDLDRLGLRPYFDTVVLSSDVGVAKPSPAIVELALRRLGVAPGSAVMVGDTFSTDVVGARAAGVRPILVSPGAPSDQPGVLVSPPTLAGLLRR
jgi:putative hydrolase of the HAD superfamily